MKTDAIDLDTLPDDPKVLKALMGKMMQRMNWLEEQFRLAQHQRFGANGEAHPGQGELFNEAEEIHATQGVEPKSETTTVTYERQQAKRKPLPAELPRERIVHDIAEADKVCACCDGELHCIGEDVSEKLAFIPAQVKVIEHVRPKYACKACETGGTENQIKQAPMPDSIIPKGYATPSLLAQVITSKYQYGLPLHRQDVTGSVKMPP